MRPIKTVLEVRIHPDCRLTDELSLAIIVSDYRWLTRYFETDE